MYYFTSDLHFGSHKTLERENRPFNSNEEFYNFIIHDFCKCNSEDIIYIVGDYVNHSDKNKIDMNTLVEMFELLKPVKAEIRVIIGNNEERIIRDLFNDDINAFIKFCENYNVKAMVDDYITFEGYEFYINHYPRKHKNEYINLFGHVHRVTGLWKPYGLNIGCDMNFYRLFSEKDILLLLKKKAKYWDNDLDVLDL